MNVIQMYGFMFIGLLIYGVLGLGILILDNEQSIKGSVRKIILKRRAYKAHKS